jgi:two-component system KDP operon response regulator KdpE
MASSNELNYNNKTIRLSNTEKVILYALIEAKGKVVTNTEMANLLFGPNTPASENMIKAYIYRLRQKIEEDYHVPQIVLTQPSVGYYLSSNI